MYGQVRGDFNWELGPSSNPLTNPFASSISMQFSEEGVFIDTFYRPSWMGFFNASISDDDGNLLLYSNGCQVRDGTHRYIPGTNSLSPGSTDMEDCLTLRIGYGVFEGGLFLPFFNDSLIVLLHQRLIIEGPPLLIFIDSLFYTVLQKDGDTYELLKKTIPIVGDFLIDGNVEAIKAAKPGAWWVLQEERLAGSFYTILFDSARVDTIFSQYTGDTTLRGSGAGQAVFSPDGTKYARYNPYDQLSLYDFDRETGYLSNFRKFHVADSGIAGGLAFSPNSRFLYACTQFDMYQLDTWAENIEDSRIHLGHYDGYADPFPSTFYHMQLGPDCRIYINSTNGIKVWHIIHDPDRQGLDCHFEQHGFHFPVSNDITIPNFPNYRLDIGPPCDSTITTGFYEIFASPSPVAVYPNPVHEDVWIRFSEDWSSVSPIHIRVVDQLGRDWFSTIISYINGDQRLEMHNLPPGFYFLQVSSGQKWYVCKFVKV